VTSLFSVPGKWITEKFATGSRLISTSADFLQDGYQSFSAVRHFFKVPLEMASLKEHYIHDVPDTSRRLDAAVAVFVFMF
jgi:hypothetical protein